MLRGDAPHLEVYANSIEDCQGSRALVGIAIGFYAHVHPLQGKPVLPGEPFDHIHSTGRHTREKQFSGANFIAANIIRDEMMRTGITDSTAMRPRAIAMYLISQSERTHMSSFAPVKMMNDAAYCCISRASVSGDRLTVNTPLLQVVSQFEEHKKL
jgi:hypothetical protein